MIFTGAFAGGPKYALAIDVGPTVTGMILGGYGIGASYEMTFTDNLSAMINIGYFGAEFSMFSPGAEARWYFTGNAAGGLFAGICFDYNFINYSGGSISFPGLGADFGYKFLSQESRGIFLEPYLGYNYLFASSQSLPLGALSIKFGLKFGDSF